MYWGNLGPVQVVDGCGQPRPSAIWHVFRHSRALDVHAPRRKPWSNSPWQLQTSLSGMTHNRRPDSGGLGFLAQWRTFAGRAAGGPAGAKPGGDAAGDEQLDQPPPGDRPRGQGSGQLVEPPGVHGSPRRESSQARSQRARRRRSPSRRRLVGTLTHRWPRPQSCRPCRASPAGATGTRAWPRRNARRAGPGGCGSPSVRRVVSRAAAGTDGVAPSRPPAHRGSAARLAQRFAHYSAILVLLTVGRVAADDPRMGCAPGTAVAHRTRADDFPETIEGRPSQKRGSLLKKG